MITVNELAKRVTAREGKKKSLSIAQVKEVLLCLKIEMAKNGESAIAALRYLSGASEPARFRAARETRRRK